MATELLFSELKAWLDAQPENTASTPYEIIIKDALSGGYTNRITRFVNIVGMEMSEGITFIDSNAFKECSKLVSITIPSSVTEIRNHAFYGCTGLTSITIPEGVTKIRDSAFYGCTGLTSSTIPEGVTEISYEVFCECSKLTSVTIPSSVTEIGADAFWFCTGLTSVTIPEGVTIIRGGAFGYCSSLTSVSMLPAFSETLMQSNSFTNTPSTLKLYIPSKNLSGWESATLSNYGFNSGATVKIIPPTRKWIRVA